MAAESEPKVEESVLGIDPPAETTTKEEPKQETPTIAKKELSEEEYNNLLEQASNYQTIVKEPKLAQTIQDHFRAKTGQVSKNDVVQDSKAQTPSQLPDETKEALDELRQTNQNLVKQLAEVQFKDFTRDHEDWKTYKDDMAKMITRYPGMSLEDAYRYAKADKPQPNGQKNGVATAPSTETHSADSDIPNSSFDDVERQINDPKISFDKSIEMAFAAAKKFSK